MKISVDGQELFTLSETQKKVLKNQIHEDRFEADMKRRIQWIVIHKYEECFKELKNEWEPKLKQRGIEMIPTDSDKFAQLIFSQPDYKNRSQREQP